MNSDTQELLKCINCGEVSIRRVTKQTHDMLYAKITTEQNSGYVCEQCWKRAVFTLAADNAMAYYRMKLDMDSGGDNVS